MDAEKVIVELIAKVDGFDTPVKQSATTFEEGMKKIEQAGSKAEKSVVDGSAKRSAAVKKEADAVARASGQMSSGFADLSSLLSGPQAPFTKIAKDAPLSSKALGIVAGAAGGMAGIFTSAAIPALLAGGAALLAMATDADSTENAIKGLIEALKENNEKTRLAEAAQFAFGQTLEGVTKSVRDNAKQLDKLNASEETAARKALELASANLIVLDGKKAEIEVNLKLAKSRIAAARANLGTLDERERFQVETDFTRANTEINELEGNLKSVTSTIKVARSNFEKALSFRVVELGKGLADPITSINGKYDRLIEQARERAVAEGTVKSTLAAQTKEIEKQRKAALAAAREAAKPPRVDRSERQSGRQITEAQARSIVAGIGGTVTSGFRTPEKNAAVGGAANSFHTKGQAIDIAKTAGLTLGKIVRAFEKEGVSLIEKLDEGDHFHVAFGKRGGRGRQGPSQETLAKRADALADSTERREQAFQNEKAGLDAALIDAKQALITSAEEIAQLELASIIVSRDKYNDARDSQVTIGTLQREEADELIKINNERAKLRAELVQRREAARKIALQEQAIENAAAFQGAKRDDEAAVLQGQLALANTQKERRAIERRLLELQFQEERARLQYIVDYNERVKANADALESERIAAQQAATIAQVQLDSSAERQTNATADSDRGTAGPLESYFGDIQGEAASINEAFESIAAGGLATFTDALTNAIVNFTSLKDVGRAVLQSITAGLVKLAIQQVILSVVGKTAQAASTAAITAQMAAIGAAAAGPAALVATASFGAASVAANAGLASTAALAQIIGAPKARGGRIMGPGTDTSDNILTPTSPDEFVIRASSARRIGFAALERMNMTGDVPEIGAPLARGGRVGGRVSRSPSNGVALAQRSGGGGFSEGDLASLRGIVSEATQALPNIGLYASLDPADMLQRALGSPAGEKALIASLGRNSGRVRATIG